MSNMDRELNRTGEGWWVYIVRCQDGTLYTGCTTDPARRIRQHNGEISGGARYTRTRRPVILLAAVTAKDRSTAQKEEARIKRLSRAQKQSWCLQHGVKDA